MDFPARGAPELGTRAQVTGELFAGSKRIELRNLATRKMQMAEDRVVAQVIVEVKIIAAKTGKAEDGYGWTLRALERLREANE